MAQANLQLGEFLCRHFRLSNVRNDPQLFTSVVQASLLFTHIGSLRVVKSLGILCIWIIENKLGTTHLQV